MVIPLAPLFTIEAYVPPPSMVIDFEMVTVPNAPVSRTLMMPPVLVLPYAPKNVLHGVLYEQLSMSSPSPETQVCVDCGYALAAASRRTKRYESRVRMTFLL